MNADRAGLMRSRRINAPHQLAIEGAADREPYRNDRRPRKHTPVSAFFFFQNMYFQPRPRYRNLLQFIEVLRLLTWPFVQDFVRKREESAPGTDLLGLRSRR